MGWTRLVESATFYSDVLRTATRSTFEPRLLRQLDYRRLMSATHAITLPKPKPRAVRQRFIVPAIRSREVTCAERPNIRRFEHFL
jgi:hypothetical protein